MNKSKILTLVTVILLFLLLIFFIILDYFNTPSYLGYKTNHLNYNMIGIFVNIFLAILIFIATYHFVNRKDVKRQDNIESFSKIILKDIYNKTTNYITMLDNKVLLCNLTKHKDEEGSTASKYHTLPFDKENLLFDLAKEGYITKEIYQHYLDVKDSYEVYVHMVFILKNDNNLISHLKKDFETKLKIAMDDVE